MLAKLTLTNVRNHRERSLEFGRLNLIVGPNGAGKTNIVEAVSLLSTTRSWRTKSDAEIISFGQEFARLEADAVSMVITRQPYRKQFSVGGIKRSTKDVIGVIQTVLFQPEDLGLILGPPQTRRHFLNVVLSQSDHDYSEALIQYQQVLRQRNHLLKRIRDGRGQLAELSFWDGELSRLAQIIWLKRDQFVRLLQQELPRHYREISGDEVEVSLRHETHPAETERLEEELVAVREREMLLGQTVRGPHRDDLLIQLNGVPAVVCASRGEVRSLTFALKMVELDYLQNASKDVLLLLDDVMSELDQNRRQRLVEVAQQVQTILTTTDLDHIPAELRADATVIELS